MTLLRLDGVTLVRGGRALFADLTIALDAGEALVVTGPNGVGKSSLIRLAAGLLVPATGTVRRDGPTALLGDATALDPERTLADALGYWARLDGVGAAAVEQALDTLRLAPLADLPVRMLSTGQRRRAALARVVAGGAALWLLDEPANGLDGASVTALEGLIARHRAGGGAVLVATHLPIEVPGARALALGNAP